MCFVGWSLFTSLIWAITGLISVTCNLGFSVSLLPIFTLIDLVVEIVFPYFICDEILFYCTVLIFILVLWNFVLAGGYLSLGGWWWQVMVYAYIYAHVQLEFFTFPNSTGL